MRTTNAASVWLDRNSSQTVWMSLGGISERWWNQMISRHDQENLRSANSTHLDLLPPSAERTEPPSGFMDSPLSRFIDWLFGSQGTIERNARLRWKDIVLLVLISEFVILTNFIPPAPVSPFATDLGDYRFWAMFSVITISLYFFKWRIAQIRINLFSRLAIFGLVYSLAFVAVILFVLEGTLEAPRLAITVLMREAFKFLGVAFLSFFIFEINGRWCNKRSFKLRALIEICVCQPILRAILIFHEHVTEAL